MVRSSASASPRLARTFGPALAALAFVFAFAPSARAAVPVGLYPVQAEGITEGERTEVQGIVEAALAAAAARGVLEPRTPLVVPGNCRAPITVGCVATLAKGGVVLYAKARRRGAQINVTVLFVDAMGRKTRAVAFPVDLFIQNLRPVHDAIATVEADLVSGALEDTSPPPPPAAIARPPAEAPAAAQPTTAVERAAPAPPPPQARPVPPVGEPAPAPQASAPIDLAPRPKAEPPPAARRPAPAPPAPAPVRRGGWKRAGTWITGSGLAMLVAGAAVGLTGMRLADALEDRFDDRELTPDDARLYDRVELYEQVANGLFIAGGAFTLAGLSIQAMAPPGGGGGVAVGGKF